MDTSDESLNTNKINISLGDIIRIISPNNSKYDNKIYLVDYIDDKIIGRSTSGNYSFNFKKNLVFGYIKNDLSNDELQSENLFIEVEKKKYPISIQLEALKRTDYKNL